MKRSVVNQVAPNAETLPALPKNNGKPKASDESLDLAVILASLQSMRDGDFTVRLPGTWVGLAGKVADTFNEIVAANQHMAQELRRVGQVVGKQGKTRERTRFHESRGAWGEMEVSVNTLSRIYFGPLPRLRVRSRPSPRATLHRPCDLTWMVVLWKASFCALPISSTR